MKETTNMPTTIENDAFLEVSTNAMGTFANLETFELSQRMAKALSQSTMIPKEYQGNIANTLIALDVAFRVNLSPFAVMQNLYIVNGRPSWSSQFIVAVINKSRRFKSPLQFVTKGEGDNMSCYAYAIDQLDNEIKGTTITIKMAKDEGWYGKSGSKWKTMPEQMLKYRAASFFGRAFCPDLIMGVYSEDEVRAMDEEQRERTEVPDPFIKAKAEPIEETKEVEQVEEVKEVKEENATKTAKKPKNYVEEVEDIFKESPFGEDDELNK